MGCPILFRLQDVYNGLPIIANSPLNSRMVTSVDEKHQSVMISFYKTDGHEFYNHHFDLHQYN